MKSLYTSVLAAGTILILGAVSPLKILHADEASPQPEQVPHELSVVLEARRIAIGGSENLTPENLRNVHINFIRGSIGVCSTLVDYVTNQAENRASTSRYFYRPESLHECVLSKMSQSVTDTGVFAWIDTTGHYSSYEATINMLHPFMTRPALAQSLVNYALPLIRRMIEGMSSEEKTALRSVLVHYQTYAQNLQGDALLAERAYANDSNLSSMFTSCSKEEALAARAASQYNCSASAASLGRKGEAFIYRRIAGGLPRTFIVNTLQTLIDLL